MDTFLFYDEKLLSKYKWVICNGCVEMYGNVVVIKNKEDGKMLVSRIVENIGSGKQLIIDIRQPELLDVVLQTFQDNHFIGRVAFVKMKSER